jgi:hypothetical protein
MQYDYGSVHYVHCERGVEGVDMVDGIYGAMCFPGLLISRACCHYQAVQVVAFILFIVSEMFFPCFAVEDIISSSRCSHCHIWKF